MNLVEVLKNKDKLLKQNLSVVCSKCTGTYFSPFDRLYILVKGQCYLCDSDDRLANNILNNI